MNIPRSHLIAQVKDLYKDLTGLRPYYTYDWDAMDQYDLQDEIAELRRELRFQDAIEKANKNG
jgi:hypothetical protein